MRQTILRKQGDFMKCVERCMQRCFALNFGLRSEMKFYTRMKFYARSAAKFKTPIEHEPPSAKLARWEFMHAQKAHELA